MAKKKNKKSQKQVETAPLPDSGPAPIEEAALVVPEAVTYTAPALASEPTPEDQPIVEDQTTVEKLHPEVVTEQQKESISPPEAETAEASILEDPVARPASAPTQDPEALQPVFSEAEEPPTTAVSSAAEAVTAPEEEQPLSQKAAEPIEVGEKAASVDRMVGPVSEAAQSESSGNEAVSTEIGSTIQSQPDASSKGDSIDNNEKIVPAEPAKVRDDVRQPHTDPEPSTIPEAPDVPATEAGDGEATDSPKSSEKSAQDDLTVGDVNPTIETSIPSAPDAPSAPADDSVQESVSESVPRKRETTKQKRERVAKEKKQCEEQESQRLEQEHSDLVHREEAAQEQKQHNEDQAKLDQESREAAEAAELEAIQAEKTRMAAEEEEERNRLMSESIEVERLEREKLAHEESERQRVEEVERKRLEDEEVDRARLELEKLEQERLEGEVREAAEAAEQERLETEARKAADVAEQALKEVREAEAVRIAAEEALREQTSTPVGREVHPPVEEVTFEPIQPSPAGQAEVLRADKAPEIPWTTAVSPVGKAVAHGPTVDPARTSSPETLAQAPEAVAYVADAARAPSPPLSHAPEPPAALDMLDRMPPTRADQYPSSPHSPGTEAARPKKRTTDPARPQAVTQLIEDNRPPAPSPPVGRARPRHTSAFDSEDDSDSALVQTRRPFRGGESRDTSHGSTYPGQPPTSARGPFASRVPVEPAYSEPPPPPPGYHPRYYAPTAPPYYQNHGLAMTQRGYPAPNPLYGPSSHSSSSPYQESWNQYPPGYPPYGSPPQRQDSSGSRDYPLHAIENGTAVEDDSADIFSRIASIAHAIPDLQVLLAQYKETHTQLRVREELLRRASVEQEEKIRAKNDEIDDLRDRIRNLDNKYSAEASRLRSQVGTLEEQARELREQLIVAEKYKKETEETKSSLDATMKSWEAKYKELEDAHMLLERTAADEKAKAWKDFEDWKSSATTKHDAEKIALAIQFDRKLKEADILAENQRQEAAAAFVREKDELRAEHLRQQREREASFERARNELEIKLGAAQRDREDALKQERESREFWFAERETLTKAHQEDHEGLKRGWIEQRDLLEAQHKKMREESDKAWIELHADATRKAEEERARADQLTQEKEELLKQFNALKAESSKEKDIIKSVATNLESEKARLEKLMECYGDIAEIKSKGDTYYLVSFSQLQKQIIDLASTHFVHLPVRPPSEDLAQVPSNLPSFLGDTPASRQVRAAYVAHTVSKLITYRVFGPFLFSLGRRYDKADSLFLSMSNHIRDKSTRKEAIWRQQTLLAAFTSSGAKQRINTAAGTVVEEIVNAIKHFADPKEEEGIKIAVKRIVKLAAETWRFARLEREMITAIMPALEDEEHEFTGPEYWPTYKPDGTLIGSLAGTAPPSDEQPQLLLRLFPVIYRESKHENFHGDGETRDEGCVFHHGLALYDDADAVVTRMEELRSAGLPSHTIVSTSPTAEHGKFPPLHDICPPPRDPLPSPPAPPRSAHRTAERTSVRSASTSHPSSPTEKSEKTSQRQSNTPPPPPSSIPSLIESMPSKPPIPPKPVTAYKRPPPGPVDFASPRNLIGLVPPVESTFSSNPSTPAKTQGATASTEAPPPAPASEDESASTPAESAIIPHSFSDSTVQESGSKDLPTPPHSPSGTSKRPVSPLFEATDEIEASQSHRSRPSTSLSRRRSTHSKRPTEEELPEVNPRPETIRRTSGYALSTRTSKTVDSERSERTEKSDRTERTEKSEKSGRDPKSKYMCESRSAAVKALYPNSPMATPNGSLKGSSVKSEKKKDRDSRDSTRDSTKDSHRGSKELKREKSIPDNGTWDTNSMSRASFEANTQLSG